MTTGKRWTGSAYTDLTTKKRWTGSAWADITTAKRWDGVAWQDIFADTSNIVTTIEDFEDTTYSFTFSWGGWGRTSFAQAGTFGITSPDLYWNNAAEVSFNYTVPTGATNASVEVWKYSWGTTSLVVNGTSTTPELGGWIKMSMPLQVGNNTIKITTTNDFDSEDYITTAIDSIKVEYTSPHIIKLESFADSTYEFPVSGGGGWTSSGHYMSAGVDGGQDSCSFTINIPVGAKNATVDWDFDVYGQDVYSYGSTVNGANRASKTSLNVGNNNLNFYIQNDGYDYNVDAYIPWIKVEYDL